MLPKLLGRHSNLLVALLLLDLEDFLVTSSTQLTRCFGKDFEGYNCRRSQVCLPAEKVCDGEEDCTDGSDEEEGCRLFDDNGCKSWYGERHVLCNSTKETVCTLPHLAGNNCRACDRPGFWRCDDGFCVRVNKVQNGVRDCRDGSDEWHAISPWIAFVTCFVAGILLFCLLASRC